MERKLFVVLLLLLRTTASFAQIPDRKVFSVKNMLPTSPEAAMLGRFGDIPIGYYTGTADVSIPLYTIKESGLEIPVVLRYHGSGVKVEDEAGWVGLGWSLEPAGAIIQAVIGKEDNGDFLADYPTDGYNDIKSGLQNYTYGGKYTDDLTSSLSKMLNNGEGQPDMYYFSFPGLSGKFYINPETDEIVQFNKKVHLSIVKNSPASWTITTMDGNIFQFTVMETATLNTYTEVTGNTWKLSRIQFYNGKVIDFEYSDGSYNSFSYSETWHDDYPGSGDGSLKSYLNIGYHNVKYLKRIVTEHQAVEFSLEDREDLYFTADNDGIAGNGSLSTKRLKSILIKDILNNKNFRSFDFTYDYFSYSTVGGSYKTFPLPGDQDKSGKRLKLTSIVENGYTAAAVKVPGKPYTLMYEETLLLPLKTSFARDFWGYYNGKSNTKMLPDLYYYKYSGFPEYQNVPSYVLNSYGVGANRTANANTVQAGILKKISYPTGGYTEFSYETNSFNNYNYPDIDQVATSQVNVYLEDKNVAGNTTSSQFTITFTQNVQFVNTINRGPNTSVTFENMLPTQFILMRIGNGGYPITHIKTWQMPDDLAARNDFAADGMVAFTEDINLEYVPDTYYVMGTYLPDALGPQNNSGNQAAAASHFIYSNLNLGASKISYGAGLRIKSIKNYNADGVLAIQKSLGYVENGNSSGVLMSPLKHFFKRTMSFVKTESIPIPPHLLITSWQNQDIWFVSSESFIPYSDAAAGNAVGYSKVQESNTGVQIVEGVHNYYFYNEPSSVSLNVPDDPNQHNGLLLKEDMLSSSADTVLKVQYNYIEKDVKYFLGLKAVENFVGWDALVQAFLLLHRLDWETYWPEGVRFSINSYPLTAKWIVQDKKRTTEYFNGTKIIKEEEFTYNTLGQKITIKTYNSRGQPVITNIKYTNDVVATAESLALKSLSIYNEVIEQNTTVDGAQIIKIKNNYSLENIYPLGAGSPALRSTDVAYNGGASQTEIEYTKTGDYKVPLELLKDGVYSVLIWSFNSTQPVAHISNATYANVESILGATNLLNFTRNANPTANDITAFLAPLRTHLTLKDAQISVYTYQPLMGMASETDPKGLTTSYDYDDFGRLFNVKDHNGNILKNYSYNYSGQ